ncbi:MAG TPA: type II toxin-antitoxin system HicB family antitoxin [Candidatus Sumerlaeota bacterium]|nr:MAG: hypothetical protein BWZ08_01312 [candidate division BRC1 bacterium ADurb.BinA292]HOE95653.1 type II toxin-antitoxin system HicB family antitoxin [Candidatus Sumerlaeota bacterium]
MAKRNTALITKGEKYYVAQCVEPGVVSQGETIDKAKSNLQEAVELYLEGMAGERLPAFSSEVIVYPLEVA